MTFGARRGSAWYSWGFMRSTTTTGRAARRPSGCRLVPFHSLVCTCTGQAEQPGNREIECLSLLQRAVQY